MSSLAAYLIACTLHVGGPPSAGFRVSRVEAPVAEPNIDVALLEAVETQLSAHGAAAAGGAEIAMLVERADWSPSRRDGDTLVYAARLRVRATSALSQRSCDVTGEVLSPGVPSAMPDVRSGVFQHLAERCAAELVAWFVLAPAPPVAPG